MPIERVTIVSKRTSVAVTFPSTGNPVSEIDSDGMTFRLTTQMTKDGVIPEKVCVECQRSFPVIAFLKTQRVRKDGRAVLSDAKRCHECEAPQVFAFHYNQHGRLAMRVQLRHENNQPVQVFDRKRRRWGKLIDLGLRLMTGTNELRFQPYKDRQRSRAGFQYGRGPLLPLDGA
jgi:hypothetical protein